MALLLQSFVLLNFINAVVVCCFQALYFTGNYNADLAAAWIFENQDKNLDAEFNEVKLVIARMYNVSNGYMKQPVLLSAFITLRAKLSGTVYCNRSCLFMG